MSDTSGVTVIGHTRFATGSLNTMPELHPHDWSVSGYDADTLLSHHDRERVWWWDGAHSQMVEKLSTFTVHLTHNGDFEVRRRARRARLCTAHATSAPFWCLILCRRGTGCAARERADPPTPLSRLSGAPFSAGI